MRDPLRLWRELPDAADRDAAGAILHLHQRRAARVQALLRGFALLIMLTGLALIPPRQHPDATTSLVLLYGVWSCMAAVVAKGDSGWRQLAWAVPLVDLPALTGIMIVSGDFTDPNWSSPFSADAFVFIPVLAAFQLRPGVTSVAGTAATVAYTTSSVVGHRHASPDLRFTLLHALFVATASTAALVLSLVQQSRVKMITCLARQRAILLARTVTAVERERRVVAEALHDGPLQGVLAARLDVDEASSYLGKGSSPGEASALEALERADEALRESARLLRSSVTELHPAVLERVGVSQALGDLARRAAQRGGFELSFISEVSSLSPEADQVLFHSGREFLSNVVRHAAARHVAVTLSLTGAVATLEVRDDGRGLPAVESQADRLAGGHIGLSSQRIRVQEAGGELHVAQGNPCGTVATVTLPVSRLCATDDHRRGAA